jgi:hypothetical protein
MEAETESPREDVEMVADREAVLGKDEIVEGIRRRGRIVEQTRQQKLLPKNPKLQVMLQERRWPPLAAKKHRK